MIIIMEENWSFDSLFRTFRGADKGKTVCNPDPANGGCQLPYADHQNSNKGGGHSTPTFVADLDSGKLDGFVRQAEQSCRAGNPCQPDVMGYHTQSDTPDLWAYAQNYVLNDHMFESVDSWSLPAHLYLFSAWSAKCTTLNPKSCTSTDHPVQRSQSNRDPYAWTDISYLLDKHGVSWAWYLDKNASGSVLSWWNVAPGFEDVRQDKQLGNIQPQTTFMAQAASGTLPSVSWVLPNSQDSMHPTALVSTGQAWIAKTINAVMSGGDWNSSVIFLAWDDWAASMTA